MTIIKIIENIFNDYTLRMVTIGSALIGLISGALGTFAVLRKQSLLGDAISHSALPGIAIAFIITGTKSQLFFIFGALIAGWISTLLFMGIIKKTKIKSDSALGIILSVFFGFGIVLLTFIQKQPNASQAGIEKFLFGQAAAIVYNDIITMVIFGFAALSILTLFWKEFKLLSFAPDFGKTMGFNIKIIDILLTAIIVIGITIGLQTVGVVLMSAMLVAPAAAARQWTNRLGVMTILAGIFGASAGIIGALISAFSKNMPTGPVIIIVISIIFVFSLFLASERGLFWNWLRRQRNKAKVKTSTILLNLYELCLQHDKNYMHSHNISALETMNSEDIGVKNTLELLKLRGLVDNISETQWHLTQKGFKEAEKLMDRGNI